MAMVCSLSVIIPTYKRRASVQRLLQSLTMQSIAPEAYEVIVSIDGSDDGTREMVAAFAAPYSLRWIYKPNRGRAAALNEGIHASSAEVTVFLDDDMEASPELLASHTRLHPSGTRLGVMGAVPIRVDPSSPPLVVYIGTKFNNHLAALSMPDHVMKLRDFYSGNFSIRREVLESVGLFDEAFRIYGNEDLELSLRLVQAGVKLMYDPEAIAYQSYSKNFSELARDTIAEGQTAVLLASMHPDAIRDLKLGTYKSEWRKWRPLRALLLLLGQRWPRITNLLVNLVLQLEYHKPRSLALYYALALDYCYWLGVRAALNENKHNGLEPSSITQLANIGLDTSDQGKHNSTL